MLVTRIALVLLLVLAAVPQVRAGQEDDLARKLSIAADEHTGRAIPAGCIPAAYPTAPTGASGTQPSVDDGYYGSAKFAMTMWRVPCANNIRQSAVLLRVTGLSNTSFGSSPFICDINMQVVQDGRTYTNLNFKGEGGGYLCNSFAIGTSRVFALDQYSFGSQFDPQKALELRYRNGSPLTVGAYSANLRKFEVRAGFTGTGTGRVTSADGSLDCRPAASTGCSTLVEETTTLFLTAAPDAGSRFMGWVEPVCGTAAATVSIVISAATTCTARFELAAVDPQSGFWFDPSRSGIGFGIERVGARMMISAYLYRNDGSPFWFNASGGFSHRTFVGKVEQFFGGPMLGGSAGPGLTVIPGGGLTVVFTSPTTAQISWDGLAEPLSLVRYQFVDSAADLAAARADDGVPAAMSVPDLRAAPLAATLAGSRVIVTMKPDDDSRQRAGSLIGRVGTQVHEILTTSQFIADVSPEGLAALRNDPAVKAVDIDKPMFFSLRQSGPLVQADQMRASGVTGTGKAVAVIDSGVDGSHPFLAGRIIAEACFSTNRAAQGATALSACPSGAISQTGPGSAAPCTSEGCAHGTHVAGIAAGAGGDIHGVAPTTSIVAVQIATTVEAAPCQPLRCTLIFMSDVLRALDWVNQQVSSLGIAAVNLSLGGESLYGGYCDWSSFKPVIDALRAKGVATIVASGNDGSFSRVTEPACVATAIAAGSTTKSGAVSWFSNTWSNRILMAPGSGIVSSVPGGGFAAMDGTSMAAPHVAGAFVLMRSLFPDVHVDSLRDKLIATGTKDTGGRGYYRINIRDAALATDQAMRILPETGWWWTPGATGRGFFVESQGSQIFIASYHYRPDGAAEWAVGQGQVGFGGLIQFDMRRFGGGTALDGMARNPIELPGMGAVVLQFSDRRTGTILLPDGKREALARFSF